MRLVQRLNCAVAQLKLESRLLRQGSFVALFVILGCGGGGGPFGSDGFGCPSHHADNHNISGSFSPAAVSLHPGESVTVVHTMNTFIERAVFAVDLGKSGDFTVTPAAYDMDLTNGSSVQKTITITANANATPAGSGTITAGAADHAGPVTVGTCTVTILDAGGSPSFTFTASPTTFTVPDYTPTGDATFTLTSLNGFSGQVHVEPTADGEVSEIPATGGFDVTLTPSAPVTFTRKFERYPSSGNHTVTYVATNQGKTISKSVAIAVNN